RLYSWNSTDTFTLELGTARKWTEFTSINDSTYYYTYNPLNQKKQLFRTDGTKEGTTSLNFYINQSSPQECEIASHKGNIYIMKRSERGYFDLWKYDVEADTSKLITYI